MFRTKKSKVHSLKERSEGLIEAFTSAIQGLKNINDEIGIHRSDRLNEKAKIEEDIKLLEEHAMSNDKIIANLEQIFKNS